MKGFFVSPDEKERVIRPIFFDKIGCEVYTSDFDTDQFGTFTGEVLRAQGPYETCVLKARTGAQASDFLLGIASEGSFGPHPQMPFIASNHEIMVFVDRENDWVISEQYLTEKTNYNMLSLSSDQSFEPFLQLVQFPSHAVTLQVEHTKEMIGKGIQDASLLNDLMALGFKKADRLLLATDMRAMMNPTRMEALTILADKLATRILTCCPSCGAPGFGFLSVADHLACVQCDNPTSMYRFEIWGCVDCDKKEKKPRQDQLDKADPTYCDYCNP